MKVFRVIDFETTDLPPNAQVIEVGITDLKWEGNSMSVGDPWSTYCNPNVPIAPGAKAVHHIEERDLFGHPHPVEVLVTIEGGNVPMSLASLDHCDYIVAHNLKFEENFFTASVPTICTLKCARNLVPEAKQHTNQFLRYFLDLPVERAKATPAHAAGPDTYVTAHLLKHLLMLSAKMGGDFVGRLVEMTKSQNLRSIPFGKYRGMTSEGRLVESEPRISGDSKILRSIPFGKYKGMSFEEIARIDRKYLRWVYENTNEAGVKAAAEKWLNS